MWCQEGWFAYDTRHPHFVPHARPSHPAARYGVRCSFFVVPHKDDKYHNAQNHYFVIFDRHTRQRVVESTFDCNFPVMHRFYDSVDTMHRHLQNRELCIVDVQSFNGAILHTDVNSYEYFRVFNDCMVYTCELLHEPICNRSLWGARDKLNSDDPQEADNVTTCSICFDAVRANMRRSITLDCQHLFHWQCVLGKIYEQRCFHVFDERATDTAYRFYQYTCPLCRLDTVIALDASDCARIESMYTAQIDPI